MEYVSPAEVAISPPPPMIIPVEAYVSEEYAKAENDKLWAKVWQIACRTEELKDVGDFVTYDILDESIIIVRSAPDKISAYYNVCMHRGRRLLSKPCGHAKQFHCNFHGWKWNVDGENTFVLDPGDWGEALNAESLRLREVKVDVWGGWVWINMDPDCQPLKDYLDPAWSMLAPYELDKMRFKWRQWLYFPCNWKTALEAFIESYHLDATHAQQVRWGSNRWWCKSQGKHSWHGMAGARGSSSTSGSGMTTFRAMEDQDPRFTIADTVNEISSTVNAAFTQTFVNVANRLMEDLPRETSAEQASAYLMAEARKEDAARGVIWPEIDADQMAAAGHDWHIFPNSAILPSITTALCYRARPNGYDPDSCIFEVYVLERYPDGEEPQTDWVFLPDPHDERWRLVLAQDFHNMPEVQKGMKSRGFPGPRPSPVQETPVTHFHQILAEYMGTGAPQPIRPGGSRPPGQATMSGASQ